MIDLKELEREALRVYGRYAEEVVEGLSFCPWARTAREEGKVTRVVITSDPPLVDVVVGAVEEQGRLPHVSISLVIFPRATMDCAPFKDFVAEVRDAYAANSHGDAGFAMAEFHPNAPVDADSPGRLTSFIRRSPDPTIQLVRLSTLAEVRASEDQGTSYVDPADLALMSPASMRRKEPLSQRIAKANRRAIEQRGLSEVAKIMNDIIDDRNRSYARLGVVDPKWRRPCA